MVLVVDKPDVDTARIELQLRQDGEHGRGLLLLPFLPMLPAQILLDNLLYDVSQIAVPTDHVDASWTRKPTGGEPSLTGCV